MHTRIPTVWDMESNDPDDFFTLLLLANHPQIDLQAVTLMPGTPAQVGLVKWALEKLGKSIPIGVYRREHKSPSVSEWHYKAYGHIPPCDEAEDADVLLARILGPESTLICGAAPKNLGRVMARMGADFRLGRWVQQGGFAGDSVVPPQYRLPKFEGRETCPSFNPNGAPQETLAGLAHPGIARRLFISKNVCHGVMYDQALHQALAPFIAQSPSLALIYQGMDVYLDKRAEGKAFHDPLAACCAIDENVGIWADVEIYRSKGEWGSRLSPTPNAQISIHYDAERFFNVLTASTRY